MSSASPPRAQNPSPLAEQKDGMAAKNFSLAREILEDLLEEDGVTIDERSRKRFGCVKQLLSMAQDSLPTGEDVEMKD